MDFSVDWMWLGYCADIWKTVRNFLKNPKVKEKKVFQSENPIDKEAIAEHLKELGSSVEAVEQSIEGIDASRLWS